MTTDSSGRSQDLVRTLHKKKTLYIFTPLFLLAHVNPIDISSTLKEKNYTVQRILEEAEGYFMSLGWPKLPKSFKEKSMFKRPNNTKQRPSCQGSAWDFQTTVNGSKDVR